VGSKKVLGLEVVELVVYAISVTGVLANAVISPALPDIARDLHVSKAGIGWIVAVASLPGVVVAPVIGLLADRLGRREVVVPCLVVFGLGGLLGAAAPSFRVLLAARLLQGFGGAGLVNLAVVILGDRYEGVERARAIGRNAAVLTGSIAVLPPIGGALTQLVGWRAAFGVFGVAFVMAVVVLSVLPPGRPAAPPTLSAQLRGARPYLSDRRVIAMTLIGFASFILVFGLVLTALPIYLEQRFGVSAFVRGLVLGLPAIGNVATALTIGRLSARFGTWQLALTGFAIFVVAFGGMAVAPTFALIIPLVLVYGVGEGLVIVPLQAYAAGIAPTEYRGVIVALWVGAVRAGQFLGPVMAGALVAGQGAPTTFALGAGFAALTLLVATPARRRLRGTITASS
jgi:MFS family permease